MFDEEQYEEPYVEPHEEDDWDSYDELEPVPRKKRYEKAADPTPIAERLRYYKYHTKLQRCYQHLRRLVTPYMEDGIKKKPNLFARVGDSAFTFTPVSATHQVHPTPVEMFGHIVQYCSSRPTLNLHTTLTTKHEHRLVGKYTELYNIVFRSDGMLPVYIAGLPFYIETMHAPFGAPIEIMFTAIIDDAHGLHDMARQSEKKIKQNFGKFANA